MSLQYDEGTPTEEGPAFGRIIRGGLLIVLPRQSVQLPQWSPVRSQNVRVADFKLGEAVEVICCSPWALLIINQVVMIFAL